MKALQMYLTSVSDSHRVRLICQGGYLEAFDTQTGTATGHGKGS